MIVEFEGMTHEFPDDATDEEVSTALEALPAAGAVPVSGRKEPSLKSRLAPVLRAAEKRYGLPSGVLDHVAEVESNWNPAAINEKTRAAGLFQFMPATAAQYGLTDPHAPEAAARTAARYLGNLRNQFGGSMAHALAAYNWGPGNMKKYGPEKMPPETRSYINRILSALESPLVEAEEAAADVAGTAAIAAKTAAQADVRKAEPRLTPMEKQRDAEARWKKNFQDWRLATGGVLKPGQNVKQAVAEWSSQRDPQETRSAAEIEHLRETGELEGVEDTLGYQIGKPAASVAGFMTYGPAGATLAELVVRVTAVGTRLHTAVKAGAIDEDQAADILRDHILKGLGADLAMNFAIPVLSKVIPRIPGASWIGDKVGKLIEKAAGTKAGQAVTGAVKSFADDAMIGAPGTGKAAPELSERAAKLAQRAGLVDDDAQKKAVEEIGRRTKDVVPTPGQVTGEAGFGEQSARIGHPEVFKRQGQAVSQAASDFLHDTTNPAGQMEAKTLGEKITQLAKGTQRAVKDRLRPAFDAADEIGVKVNAVEIHKIAAKALADDARVSGGKLSATERLDLEKVVDDIENGLMSIGPKGPTPYMTPEGLLDFISRRKELRRGITAAEKPSKEFGTVIGDLVTAADKAYTQAAQTAGKADVVRDLLQARTQYRGMMDTVYKGTIKKALQKEGVPEDIGKLIYQSGNVSEIEQFHRLLGMAASENVLGAAGARELKQNITRGFLQESVKDLRTAAEWSEIIKSDPLKRRTWATLTAGPEGKAIADSMRVVEEAAKMALRDHKELVGMDFVPISRAAKLGLGVSLVTGAFHAPMAIAGLGIAGLTRAMATAYTQGNKGMANLVMQVLRANSAGTIAGAEIMKTALPKIEKWAEENNILDLFVSEAEAAEKMPARVRDAVRGAPNPPDPNLSKVTTPPSLAGGVRG